jgi:hypothetical protein
MVKFTSIILSQTYLIYQIATNSKNIKSSLNIQIIVMMMVILKALTGLFNIKYAEEILKGS